MAISGRVARYPPGQPMAGMARAERKGKPMPMMMGGGGGWAFLFWGVLVLAGLGGVVWRYMLAKFRPGNGHLLASDPMELARERYAQGLMTKQEFEDVVQHLLHTERADD